MSWDAYNKAKAELKKATKKLQENKKTTNNTQSNKNNSKKASLSKQETFKPNEISITSNTKKSIKSKTKKLGVGFVSCILVIFIISSLIGYFTFYYLTKDDCFEMNKFGEEIDVIIGDNITTYTEFGAKCISFGKDMSNKVQITYKFLNDDNQLEIVDMVDENISGNYYAEYTINDLKYNSVLLIRNIQVLSKEV